MAEAPMTSLFLFTEVLPEFVNEDPRYLCRICNKVLNNPMQTECGHRMCRQCLDEMLSALDSNVALFCPVQNDTCGVISRDNITPDFSIRREMGRQEVYCTNPGCRKIMKWNDLKNHLKECQMSQVDCPNKARGCKPTIALKELEKHVRDECPYRELVSCGYCSLEMLSSELSQHVNTVCPLVQIRCKFCQTSACRKDKHHHEKNCPAKPKQCSFKCGFQGTEEQLRLHSETHVNTHLGKLSQKCDDQCDKYMKLVDGLRKDVEEIGKQNKQVFAENRNLKKSVEQAMKTIANQVEKIIALEHKMEILREENHTLKKTLKKTVGQASITIANQVDEKTALEHKIDKMEQNNHRTQAQIQKMVESNSHQLKAMASTSGLSDDVRKQLVLYDQMAGSHEIRLTDMSAKFECLQSTSYNGTLIWKIGNYSSRKEEAAMGRTPSVFSQPFYTDRFGYKMCARVYLNGDGLGKGTHMSLFFVLLKGKFDALQVWPFRQKVMFTLIDQDTGQRQHSESFRPDPTSSSFKRPVDDMNVASGCPLFLPHSVIESKTYLKDDTIFIKIVVKPTDTKIFSN